MSSNTYSSTWLLLEERIFIYIRVQTVSLLRIITDTNEVNILSPWTFQQYADALEFTATNKWDVLRLNMDVSQ